MRDTSLISVMEGITGCLSNVRLRSIVPLHITYHQDYAVCATTGVHTDCERDDP